ncbi:Glutamate--cysteine ligase EgtA [Mycobacterium talmoniae]|uniref:glutamate--cysteine ligase n=1 Tax=Mycobacterium talmoniae TaxID=1858794 RepID=A0A2S8BD20_9MYCO|nr:Glutamate--cysteine ligase EgtA [Mycobacterium talmoniae]
MNLDAGPRAGWAARVWLAHALGPTMVAIAANSPLLGGAFSGWQSTRQWVWSQLDAARCGPILGGSGADPGPGWRLAHSICADERLAGAVRFATDTDYRRLSCCLYYRTPGGGLCGDCALTKKPTPRKAAR